MAWYDDITPQQAKAFMNSPVETRVVRYDQRGRPVLAPCMPSLNVIHKIAQKAAEAA